jgi:hypothetical protein
MLRTTTLLIVMVLAGPGGSLACDLWCGTPAAEDHHRAVGCHDASQKLRIGRQVASTIGCHVADPAEPVIAEVRQTATARVAAVPLVLSTFSWIALSNHVTNAGWAVRNSRPPRPASSRIILRV